jgi:WS/DGAT/MGAT family acyltransferase
MAPQLSKRMSAQDASFLYFETHDAPLHIGSVGVFEGKIDFERFRASLASRMHLIPRYRQRAVFPPLFAGHPTWEDDPQFSIDRHVNLVEIPAPGTREQLAELCCELFEPILTRDRPLWDIYVIHGLDGGKNSAMLSRVHHCMVDGVSGIELLLAIMDLVPDPEPTSQPDEAWQPSTLPNPLQSWSAAMIDNVDRGIRSFTEFQQSLMDPREQFRQITSFAQSLEVTLPAAIRPRFAAPWHKRVTRKRRVAWTELNFQEVRGIRGKLSGTVNDVVLTVLGGAFGKYIAEKGIKTEAATLRFMCPVNVRSETEQGALGNRVSMMLPEVPVGIASPADRLMAVRAEVDRLKASNQSSALERSVRMGEDVPAYLYALAGLGGVPSGGANVICTNVPGLLIPLYSVGHRLLASYPMLPLAGDLGVSIAIMSYNKHLYLGIMSDPTIIDDVDTIRKYVDEEFAMLRYVADVPVSDLPEFGAPRNGNGASPKPKHEPSTPIAKAKPAPEEAPAPVVERSSAPSS